MWCMRELIITDLEEQILFLLQMHETNMSLLNLTDKVSAAEEKIISMAKVHETISVLEIRGFVRIDKVNNRTQCTITATGIKALHQDWNYYTKKRGVVI